MAKSFYETVKGLVPASFIDHRASDLYVRDTPLVRAIIRQFGRESSSFVSEVDGQRWLDVPFAYEPFWAKKSARGHATRKKVDDGTWTTEHKSSGATVIERQAFGSTLKVVPMDWREPNGPANWSVTHGSSRQGDFDHKRGSAETMKAAKTAAMMTARSMKR